jgi:hypothetical protein
MMLAYEWFITPLYFSQIFLFFLGIYFTLNMGDDIQLTEIGEYRA